MATRLATTNGMTTTTTTTTTTPHQNRMALSDLPGHYTETLRLIAGTPDNTTNIALSQESLLSPMPSPDELVIRQRGRRRLRGGISPETHTAAATATAAPPPPADVSPFQRTPTKLPPSTAMILRCSPRKRLTMGSTPPDIVLDKRRTPKKLLAGEHPLCRSTGSPSQRKLQLDIDDDRPFSQINADIPLRALLAGLCKSQLIDVLVSKVIGSDPNLEKKIRAQLPMPDVDRLADELFSAKRNIFRSLPKSRLSRKTDGVAYSRAEHAISEFKRILVQHTTQLCSSENWDAVIDYMLKAWVIVRATPIWDSTLHNATRNECFKVLATCCRTALKCGGVRLGLKRLCRLERKIPDWSKDHDDLKACIGTINRLVCRA